MTPCPSCGSMFRNQRYVIAQEDPSFGGSRARTCDDAWHSPYVESVTMPRDGEVTFELADPMDILRMLANIERKLDTHIAETNRRLDVIRAEFHPRV